VNDVPKKYSPKSQIALAMPLGFCLRSSVQGTAPVLAAAAQVERHEQSQQPAQHPKQPKKAPTPLVYICRISPRCEELAQFKFPVKFSSI
jgi:hypothetical protein